MKLFHCFITSPYEYHHFTIIVDDSTIILLSTYGGQRRVIKRKYNKSDWIKLFAKSGHCIQSYCEVFDLDLDIDHSLFTGDICPEEIRYHLIE